MSSNGRKFTVRCELLGQCDIDICPQEVEGMDDDEIREWLHEGAYGEFWDQGKYSIRLRSFDEVLKRFRQHEKEVGTDDDDAE